MSMEESLKRKSSERELDNVDEVLNEPLTKVQKIDTETIKPNLQKIDVFNVQENNAHEISNNIIITRECVEENDTDINILEQFSQSSQSPESPQPPQSSQSPESPQPPQSSQSPESPQPQQPSQSPEPPQPSQSPESPQSSQSPESPQPPQSSQSAESPQPPQSSQSPESPQPPQSSQSAESPQPLQSSQSPEPLQPPQSSQSPESPQPAQSSQSAESLWPLQFSQSVESPQALQSSQSPESPQPPQSSQSPESPQPLQYSQSPESPQPTQPSQPLLCNISIKFHDETSVEKYKAEFLRFLGSFVELQVKVQDNSTIDVYRREDPEINKQCVTDDTIEDATTQITEATIVSKTLETETHVCDTLTINDSTPLKKKHKKRSKIKKELFIVDATPSPNGAQAGLRYTTKFTINPEKEKITEENKLIQSSKLTCFNCDQLHSLKDCPLPKNYNKINQARQKLFRQQSKSSRYHIEEEQKFNHLSPGKLSHDLKKALGLHRNEAPHFIYLMRKLGYPPGWLEEAKFVHSNLEMFDIDGNNVKTSAVMQRGLDSTKIVEYPGFNVPFEKGVKDEYRRYGVPPYSEEFSKEAMISFFEKKVAQEEDNLETCDMDIDHEQETSNQEKQSEKKQGGNEDRDSPSLLDLEQQKQLLLEELKDETKEEKSEKDLLTVKTTHFGTPILRSNSQYLTLPDPDKFSKDVSPVINFENLPNSTGKYEQMTDVLQKVRTTLKKMNSCNT